jgi:hypothetical protein
VVSKETELGIFITPGLFSLVMTSARLICANRRNFRDQHEHIFYHKNSRFQGDVNKGGRKQGEIQELSLFRDRAMNEDVARVLYLIVHEFLLTF